jgi:hypothetical protein
MQKIKVLLYLVLISSSVFAQEKRNLLTNTFSKSFVAEVLANDYSWIKYPDYNDRTEWEKFPKELREKYIKEGKKYLDFVWPIVRATEYLAFDRIGDRMVMENPQSERMKALQSLVLAELMEGKGRFMDDIINGTFLFCEQTYWGLSACFYLYKNIDLDNGEKFKPNLPNNEDSIIDLWVGEIGSDLAWIYYFFKDEFNKTSPIVSRRLKYELTNRILEPYYIRNDLWWIRGGIRGNVNNWTPWCNYNVLTCILLVEEDSVKKINGVYKTMESVDLFYNIYPNDGGCDEGPAYWGYAGGKAFEYISLLDKASKGKISIFDHPLIGEIGRYVYRAYIAGGKYFINFADSSPKGQSRAGVIYQYGQKIEDQTLTGFGAFQLSKMKYGEEPEITTLGPVLANLFSLDGWEKYAENEPLIGEYYFPDLQVAVVRDKEGSSDGFFMAAKGGHNDEQHNHNDVGSCIIFYNGNPVLVDAGVGTYTKQTFSNERYKIWTMQSDYHNLPLINGISQNQGRNYKAKDSRFTKGKSKITFSTNITDAYPQEAGVENWIREYSFERGEKITISDNFKLKKISGKTELHFITPLQCNTEIPGVVYLKGEDITIQMKYGNNVQNVRFECKEIDDEKLTKVWGNKMFILVFDIKGISTGKIPIDISVKK